MVGTTKGSITGGDSAFTKTGSIAVYSVVPRSFDRSQLLVTIISETAFSACIQFKCVNNQKQTPLGLRVDSFSTIALFF